MSEVCCNKSVYVLTKIDEETSKYFWYNVE